MAVKDTAPGAAQLRWLADSPMFIDAEQVGALYDVIACPAELQITRERLQQLLGARPDTSLTALFPWLSADSASEAAGTKTASRWDAPSIAVHPARQLVEVALHYLLNQPERVCFTAGKESRLPAPDAILKAPRMIAFLDAEPGTKFLPVAAELGDGRVVRLAGQLAETLKEKSGQSPGQHPEEESAYAAWDSRVMRRVEQYWGWFAVFWHANKVAGVLEDALAATGWPRWVDYRAWLNSGEKLHLTVRGNGRYDAGVLASNLVQRGYRYGMRIVGSLKSGPSMNVLAIYEK